MIYREATRKSPANEFGVSLHFVPNTVFLLDLKYQGIVFLMSFSSLIDDIQGKSRKSPANESGMSLSFVPTHCFLLGWKYQVSLSYGLFFVN